MTDQQMSYDPERVIRRLAERSAALLAENAKLEDVITTLLEQRNTEAREAEEKPATGEGAERKRPTTNMPQVELP